MNCPLTYEVCVEDAHPCMGHKLKYMRQGVVGIAPIPAGWGGATVREQVADTLTRAKQNGIEPAYAGRAVLR